MDKQYIGDGVYIQRMGYNYILTASNGLIETDIITIEPGTMENLKEYLKEQGIL